MINLLPDTLKENYQYGRRNAILRKWCVAMLFGLLGVGLITFAGYFYMQQTIASYAVKVEESERSLQSQKLVETQKRAQEITNSLKLATDVLSKEVLFSQLLRQIGAVTPPNTVLTDLSISEVAGALELTAKSADYTSATQMQVNLQDPANRIFSKADIQNIACSSGATASDPRYPCTLRLRALFSEDNPFLFINDKVTKR